MLNTRKKRRNDMSLRNKLVMVLMLLLSGCATYGREFDMAAVDKIVIGQTTKAEVIALFGSPIGISKTSDGHTFLAYSYSHATMGGAEVQTLSIAIDRDGKVENTFTNSTNSFKQ